jgi:hypothetical protein
MWLLLAAMGGSPPPIDLTGVATEICSKRMVQMATRYQAIDLSSQVIGKAQVMSDGKVLVRLAVTINYRRKGGVETRRAIIGCLVNQNRIEILEALPRG